MSNADTDNILGSTGFYTQNPFTDQHGPIPFPGYAGWPTDAQGNPIQPPSGTSLNSVPGNGSVAAAGNSNPNVGMEPLGSQARAMQNAGYGDWAMLDPTMASTGIPGQTGGPQSVAATKGWNPANPGSAIAPSASMMGSGTNNGPGGMGVPGTTLNSTPGGVSPSVGTLGPGAPGTNTGANTQGDPSAVLAANGLRQQATNAPPGQLANAISLLSNPGHVTTPGAQPSAGGSSTPSVLSQFLANNSGGAGAGGYNNSGFFSTLNALKSGGTPGPTDLTPSPGAPIASALAPVAAPGASPIAAMAPTAPMPAAAPMAAGGLGGMGGMHMGPNAPVGGQMTGGMAGVQRPTFDTMGRQLAQGGWGGGSGGDAAGAL